jgi:hypothetical protein
MKKRFEDFKEIIELAQKNSLPIEAKLIIVGRISYASEIDELSLDEAKELENMLGGRNQWQDAFEMALSGAIDSSPHQMAS